MAIAETIEARPRPSASVARPLSLKTNVIWNFGGNAFYAACQWAMLVVLAKRGSAAMVGQFAIALAITAPVIMFANLHLQAVQRTDDEQRYTFGDYFALRLITTALALLVIGGIVLVVDYRGETALVILIIGLSKSIEAISNVFQGFYQQHERMDRVAQSLAIKGSLSLIALTTAVALTGRLLWGAVALLAVSAITLISYDWRQGRALANAVRLAYQRAPQDGQSDPGGLKPRWAPETLRALALLSLPLGIAALLMSLNVNVPRYFIERELGQQSLGIYAAMAYLVVAANMVASALGESASPRLAQAYTARNWPTFHSLLLKLMAIGVVCGLFGVMIVLFTGRQLLTVLYAPEYGRQHMTLFWLMIATCIGYIASVLTYGITAARRFGVQAPLSGSVVLVTAIACAVLIPRYGLIGAAYAANIAAVVNLIGNAIVLRREQRRATPSGDPPPRTRNLLTSAGWRRRLHLPGWHPNGYAPWRLSLPAPSWAPAVARAVTDVNATSRLFFGLCCYLVAQGFTVPLLPIGPSWAIWPNLPDIAVGILIVAWMFYPGSKTPMPAPNQAVLRRLIVIFGGCVVSYLMLTVLIKNVDSLAFAQDKSIFFGLFALARLAEFILLFFLASTIPLTAARIRTLRRICTAVLLFVCFGIFVTYTAIIPTSRFISQLPASPAVSGPWYAYGLNFERDGLGTIGYNHAYVGAQVILLFGFLVYLWRDMPTGLLLSLLTLSTVAEFLTGSRAGLLTLLLFAVFVIWRRSPLAAVLSAGILALATLSILLLASSPGTSIGTSSIVERQLTAFQFYHADNLSGRNTIWQAQVERLNAHPIEWIVGAGFGAAADTTSNLSAHMFPLQVVMETGLIGLIIVAYAIGGLLVLLWRKEERPRPLFWMTVSFLSASVSYEIFYPIASMGHFLGFFLVIVAITLRRSPADDLVVPATPSLREGMQPSMVRLPASASPARSTSHRPMRLPPPGSPAFLGHPQSREGRLLR